VRRLLLGVVLAALVPAGTGAALRAQAPLGIAGVQVGARGRVLDARAHPSLALGSTQREDTLMVRVLAANRDTIPHRVAVGVVLEGDNGVRYAITLLHARLPRGTHRLDVPMVVATGTEARLALRADLWEETPSGRVLRDSTAEGTYGLSVHIACGAPVYRLERLSPPGPPGGAAVVLIHGFRPRRRLCSRVHSEDLRHYWGLQRAGSAWTALRRQLEARGAEVWLYGWPTYASVRAAGDNLRRLLRDSTPAAGGLTLVGHSFGGLVALQAWTGGDGLRGRVRRVVALASPLLGTVRSDWLPGLPPVALETGMDAAFLDSLAKAPRGDTTALVLLGGVTDASDRDPGDGAVSLASALGAGRYAESVRGSPRGPPAPGSPLLAWALVGYCHAHMAMDYDTSATSYRRCTRTGLPADGGVGLRALLAGLVTGTP
jgi:hypothetical protein